MSRELITIEEYKARKLETLGRIAEALEKRNEILLSDVERIREGLGIEGEKSVEPRGGVNPVQGSLDGTTDSTPLPKVVETQNFVDVRECSHYSEKSYKLIGYDSKYCYIAKSHVIRTEAIEGGGTRVIVGVKSAWVLNKLGWK